MAKAQRKNDYESFDKLLSRFKKAVDNDNILRIRNEKEYYEKPTSKRKKAKALAVKRHRRKLINESNALIELRSLSKK